MERVVIIGNSGAARECYWLLQDMLAADARLRDRLPKYMLPSVCRRLERFPQNRTGKIDRRALLILSKED